MKSFIEAHGGIMNVGSLNEIDEIIGKNFKKVKFHNLSLIGLEPWQDKHLIGQRKIPGSNLWSQ